MSGHDRGTCPCASSTQDAVVVYALGGEASPEEYAAALGAVSTALRTAGRQPQAAEANCDPDHDCFEAVLVTHECDAAAVVTYWAQSESRDVRHLVITLADSEGRTAWSFGTRADSICAGAARLKAPSTAHGLAFFRQYVYAAS